MGPQTENETHSHLHSQNGEGMFSLGIKTGSPCMRGTEASVGGRSPRGCTGNDQQRLPPSRSLLLPEDFAYSLIQKLLPVDVDAA